MLRPGVIASSAWNSVVDSLSAALDQGDDHARTIALIVGAGLVLYLVLRINIRIAQAILREKR